MIWVLIAYIAVGVGCIARISSIILNEYPSIFDLNATNEEGVSLARVVGTI